MDLGKNLQTISDTQNWIKAKNYKRKSQWKFWIKLCRRKLL